MESKKMGWLKGLDRFAGSKTGQPTAVAKRFATGM